MPRTVSDEFKALWAAKGGVVEKRRIGYKRRYWNGSAFVNEAAWRYFYEDDYVTIGVIPWTSDSPRENVFRTSVVTITFYNTRNEWVVSPAAPSLFAADDTATSGYKLYKTIFQIQEGYVLQDGTTEWITQFTGYAIKPKLASKAGTTAISVISKSSLRLEKSDPGSMGTTSTLENCIPATGDGIIVDFESTSVGVDHSEDLQVDGSSLTPGSGYRVSNTKEITAPGNTGRVAFKLNAAPANGKTVKCSVVKWDTDQLIEDILAAVAVNAGLAADEYDIDPIILPAATGYKKLDTQAEWEAEDSGANFSTLATINSVRRKWILVDNFTDGDLSADPVWTANGAGNLVPSIVSGSVKLENAKDHQIYTTNPAVPADGAGTWRFQIETTYFTDPQIYLRFFFAAQTTNTTEHAWRVIISGDGTGFLYFEDVEVDTFSVSVAGGWHELRITRDTDGNCEVFWDGASVGSGQDETPMSTYYLRLEFPFVFGEPDNYILVDGIYYSPEEDGTGTVSAADTELEYVFDLASTPTAMGILERVHTLNGGTVTYKTAGAADVAGSPGTWDTLVEVSEDGQQNHTAKQWLKIYIKIEHTSTYPGIYLGPVIDRVRSNFSTSTVTLALADLSGLSSGVAVFEKYAGLVDYETGDDPDAVRFFRSKTPSAESIGHFTQENAILEVMDWDDGTDDIINVGRVRFGEYLEEYDGSDASEASPTSEEEYGRIAPPGGELNLGSFLISNDVNIAEARARLLYERHYAPKKSFRLKIWNIPWAELGDRMTVTIYDQPIMGHVVANDPIMKAGSPFTVFGTPLNVLAVNMDVKLLQYKPNYDTNVAEAFVREI